MALQSSGQITLSEIWSEYNSGATPGANENISLGSLSVNTADGGGDPDAMSEFYGLSSAPPFVNTENFAISTYTGNGGTQSIDAAPAGKSAVFNGTSSRIDTGYNLGTDSSYSISVWMNTTVTSTRQYLYGILPTSGANNGPGMGLGITAANTFEFYLGNNSAYWQDTTVSASSYTNGNWHHLVLVVNGTSVKLYANGNTTPIANLTSTISAGFSGGTNLIIGRFGSYPGTTTGTNLIYYNGKLDQVRIYSSALSSSDVTNLYNETNVPTANLVAHYKLDGNANDSAGSYNGTATNVTYAADAAVGPTISGGAAFFAGGAGTSKITTSLDLDSYDENWSISMWVKYIWDSTYRGIAGSCDSSSANGMIIDQGTSGQLRFRLRIGTGSYSAMQSSATYGDGQWHHIVAVKGSTTNYLYIDGNKEILSATTTNGVTHSPFTLGIIGSTTSTVLSLRGSIDDVRVYNDELTAAEALNIYNNTSIPTDNLISHWKLDGNANDEQGTHTSTVTNVGWVGSNFRPDLVWIKDRDGAYNHALANSVSGAGTSSDSNFLVSNNMEYEGWASPAYGYLSSFNTNGFNLSQGSINSDGISRNGAKYVAWAWKAGGPAVSNTDGTVTSTVSANQDAGFSIVSYTTPSSVQGTTVGHGLGAAPELIIVKARSAADAWVVTSSYLPNAWNDWFILNSSAAAGNNDSTMMHTGAPTSSTFSLGRWHTANTTNIAYCFRSISGYQKIGSYTGATAGVTVTTGFQPRFIMVKRTSATGTWLILDSNRDSANPNTKYLRADVANAEADNIIVGVNFISNGFQIPSATTSDAINWNGSTYIYLAIA